MARLFRKNNNRHNDCGTFIDCNRTSAHNRTKLQFKSNLFMHRTLPSYADFRVLLDRLTGFHLAVGYNSSIMPTCQSNLLRLSFFFFVDAEKLTNGKRSARRRVPMGLLGRASMTERKKKKEMSGFAAGKAKMSVWERSVGKVAQREGEGVSSALSPHRLHLFTSLGLR